MMFTKFYAALLFVTAACATPNVKRQGVHIILDAAQAIDRLDRYWKRPQFAHLGSRIGYLGDYFCLCVIFWLHSSTRDVQLRLPS